MGFQDSSSILYYNPRNKELKKMPGVSMISSKHCNTQLFVINAKKSIDPKNILEYYSSGEI